MERERRQADRGPISFCFILFCFVLFCFGGTGLAQVEQVWHRLIFGTCTMCEAMCNPKNFWIPLLMTQGTSIFFCTYRKEGRKKEKERV